LDFGQGVAGWGYDLYTQRAFAVPLNFIACIMMSSAVEEVESLTMHPRVH